MGLFAQTKAWLRRTYPVPFPVRVYCLSKDSPKVRGCAGLFVTYGPEKSFIYIAEANEGHMAETLIEEWSHALRHAMPLDVDYEGEAHDEHFWVTYGRITNAWRKRFFA
jgi:hypothetical protein